MIFKIVASNGRKTLPELQDFIQKQEDLYGPLARLGHQGVDTKVTLQIGDRPRLGTVLKVTDAWEAEEMHGFEVVCSGECLVDGEPVRVVAYRPR